jgi:hypothetical protein
LRRRGDNAATIAKKFCIGVAVKGDHYRLREPLPPEAEEALTPFRNFVRFVEAKRYDLK